MPSLNEKTKLFTDSVIRRMTRICLRYDGINLSQGYPDWNPPDEMLDELKRTAQSNVHQYSITFGAKNLRDVIAAKFSKAVGYDIDADNEVVVTCGSTEAMLTAMMSVCNVGDKVIVFSPFYENYGADTILSGAEPIFVHLKPPDFSFDKTELDNAFKQGVKAIILCNPSNPSGKVFTRDELEFIAAEAKKYDTFVVTDEVYEHMVYPPAVHTYMASLEGMRERTISTSSFSKTYSMTGWRIGYLIANPTVVEAAKKVHDFLTVGAPAPLQEAACNGIERLDEEYYDALMRDYLSKRDFFCNGLTKIGLRHTLPQGSYFVLVDISDFLAKDEFKGWTDLQFCEWMIERYRVAAVPCSAFFENEENRYIRFHFARSEATLAEALSRLERMSNDYLK